MKLKIGGYISIICVTERYFLGPIVFYHYGEVTIYKYDLDVITKRLKLFK